MRDGSVQGTDNVPDGGAAPGDALIYAFGDPEGVLDRAELIQYFEIWHNGRWYEPPMPAGRIAQAFNMSPHHRSAIQLKTNMLVSQHIESRWMRAEVFERFALDFLQMGNAYLEFVPNIAGRIARIEHAPSVHMRAGIEDGQYWFVNAFGQEHAYPVGAVYHLQQPDVAQEIYGLPEWLSALQSGLLSEAATLFRRKYYVNGAHAGFVFYVSEPLADQKTVDAMEKALSSAKGRGNFKNLFVNIPKGKKDGVQVIPLSDITARDEFLNVKNISRDDMLAAHRTPPQLIGIIPQNNGGFGSIGDARDAFYATEIIPIMRRMLRANAWAGVPVLSFADYQCVNGDVIRQDGKRIPAGR